MTYFKPKNMGDVRLRLGGLDDAVPVTLAPKVQLPTRCELWVSCGGFGDGRHGTGSWSSER
jgi:hypothetical protein